MEDIKVVVLVEQTTKSAYSDTILNNEITVEFDHMDDAVRFVDTVTRHSADFSNEREVISTKASLFLEVLAKGPAFGYVREGGDYDESVAD